MCIWSAAASSAKIWRFPGSSFRTPSNCSTRARASRWSCIKISVASIYFPPSVVIISSAIFGGVTKYDGRSMGGELYCRLQMGRNVSKRAGRSSLSGFDVDGDRAPLALEEAGDAQNAAGNMARQDGKPDIERFECA